MNINFIQPSGSDKNMIREMIQKEILRILKSVNTKIMRVPRMTASEVYMLQLVETVIYKVGVFEELVEKGKIDGDEVMIAMRGEMHRAAIILFMMNNDGERDFSDLMNLERAMLGEVEKYIGIEIIDLAFSLMSYGENRNE